MKKLGKGLLVLSISVLIGVCGCNNKNNQEEAVSLQDKYNVNHVYEDVSNNFENIYNDVVQSTVRIKATSSTLSSSQNDSSNLGSGVVYKEEGNYAYILTNAHVLATKNAEIVYDNFEVTFSNYNKAKAILISLDVNEDIGVIRIDKSNNYKVAKVIASDTDSKVGETVFSIGQPNGQYFAVTAGVLSYNRMRASTSYISGNGYSTYVFNTTATSNSGNSGGPLFNSKGEVIAINTMIPNSSSTSENAGTTTNHNYSIPINYFIKVANYIATNTTGYVRPKLPSLTVTSICDMAVNDLVANGISVSRGVYVKSSTGQEIITGKVITQVNGNDINTKEDYEFELLKYSVNDAINLTVSDKTGTNVRIVTVRLGS